MPFKDADRAEQDWSALVARVFLVQKLLSIGPVF